MEIYKKITRPEEIKFFDGYLIVLFEHSKTHDMCVKKCILKPEYDDPISLESIYAHYKECSDGVITVIYESWTHGEIYKYGNYGNWWYRCGETIGFA